MCEPTATRTVEVTNPQGVHARAATLIAEGVRRHQSQVALQKGSMRVDGTEVLQILSLGAAPGDQVVLEATGEDAHAVLDCLEELFTSNFHDEPSTPT